jgi:hypothetical protein
VDQRFDLFLNAGCATFPAVADLVPSVPALARPEVQIALTQPRPGWLGVDAPRPLAELLLARLRAVGARGEVVEAAYRTPALAQDDARRIAERVLPAMVAQLFPGYQFKPPVLRREMPRWYAFISVSDRLVAEGHLPGGVVAHIDKLDGHLWDDAAIARVAPGA